MPEAPTLYVSTSFVPWEVPPATYMYLHVPYMSLCDVTPALREH